jgi:glycosyltransferase, family 2
MENGITVIIPAHNEERSIAKVVRNVRKNKKVKEIIVVNNASTDNTADVARSVGAILVNCDRRGKGHAMEEGIKRAQNDILLFMDGDITNYKKNIIDIMTEDIFSDEADFIKSAFTRSGGRVTELVAKPLIELLFPEAARFEQPLSGIIAGKREFFNRIELEKDYGVDIGILLDMLKINARVKEAYIGKLKNDSQDWKALAKMSREVSRAIISRADNISKNNNLVVADFKIS